MKVNHIVKRGSGIMRLEVHNLVFGDILNYTAKCKLSVFAKTWGGLEEKGVFPYEHYNSIEEMKNDKEFPSYLCFKSSLHQPKLKNFKQMMKNALDFVQKSNIINRCDFITKLGIEPKSTDNDILNLNAETINPFEYVYNWALFDEKIWNDEFCNMYDFLCYYNIKGGYFFSNFLH